MAVLMTNIWHAVEVVLAEGQVLSDGAVDETGNGASFKLNFLNQI